MMRPCTGNSLHLRLQGNEPKRIRSSSKTELVFLDKKNKRYVNYLCPSHYDYPLFFLLSAIPKETVSNFKQAWRKIDETKKRAKDIIGQRQRNVENQYMKQERQRLKEEEEQMRQAQNRALKEQLKQNIDYTKNGLQEKLKYTADNVKQEKQQQKDFLYQQKQQEQLKNSSLKQMIKSQ